VQTTVAPILKIYTLREVFLRKELPFRSHDDCTCIKSFSSINYRTTQLC